MTDTDKTEAPVTNEELYVELRKNHRRTVAIGGLVPLTGALVLLGIFADVEFALAGYLGAPSLLFLLMAESLMSDGWGHWITSRVPYLDLPEPESRTEERLTDAARTDGRGGDES